MNGFLRSLLLLSFSPTMTDGTSFCLFQATGSREGNLMAEASFVLL